MPFDQNNSRAAFGSSPFWNNIKNSGMNYLSQRRNRNAFTGGREPVDQLQPPNPDMSKPIGYPSMVPMPPESVNYGPRTSMPPTPAQIGEDMAPLQMPPQGNLGAKTDVMSSLMPPQGMFNPSNLGSQNFMGGADSPLVRRLKMGGMGY
jgi:hypothetical protein